MRKRIVVEVPPDRLVTQVFGTFIWSADDVEVEVFDLLTVHLLDQLNRNPDLDAADVVSDVVALGRVADDVLDLLCCKNSREFSGDSGKEIYVVVENRCINFEIGEATVDAALRCAGAIEYVTRFLETHVTGATATVSQDADVRLGLLQPSVYA